MEHRVRIILLLLLLSLASCKDERWRFLGSSAEEEKVCRNLSIAGSMMEERPDSDDLHHTSSATLAWKNVLAIDAEDAVVYRYKAKTVSWLGEIYEKEKIYNNFLVCNGQAYKYAVKSDYPKKLMAHAMRNIGCSYSYLGNNKKAITYYIQAYKLARQIPDEKLSKMTEQELAAIYIEEGMLQEAEKILLHPGVLSSQKKFAPYYYTTGKYYEAKGDIFAYFLCRN